MVLIKAKTPYLCKVLMLGWSYWICLELFKLKQLQLQAIYCQVHEKISHQRC
jgi:hypothetical protein